MLRVWKKEEGRRKRKEKETGTLRGWKEGGREKKATRTKGAGSEKNRQKFRLNKEKREYKK